MDNDKPIDTNENQEVKDTTLDLTGLKHNDTDALMNEAIAKVNQVENLEQLEKIDKLTTDTDSQATVSEKNNTNQGETKARNDTTRKENNTIKDDIKKENSDLSEDGKQDKQKKENLNQKTKIKIQNNVQQQSSAKSKKTERSDAKDEIVLEMSGGIIEPKKKKKKLPKISFKLPKLDKSKKIILIVIGGLVLLSIVLSIVIFFILPKVKTALDNKKLKEQVNTSNETIEAPPQTIENMVIEDDINTQLSESSSSSLLKDVKADTNSYPISEINKDLENLTSETTPEVKTHP